MKYEVHKVKKLHCADCGELLMKIYPLADMNDLRCLEGIHIHCVKCSNKKPQQIYSTSPFGVVPQSATAIQGALGEYLKQYRQYKGLKGLAR